MTIDNFGVGANDAARMLREADQERRKAAACRADWTQVVLNGGPPCFHLKNDRFCLRAERWFGHDHAVDHAFISLAALLDLVRGEGEK